MSAELPRQEPSPKLLWYIRLFSAGLAAGALANGEMMQWYIKSQKELVHDDIELRPPRPPRRPNAPTRLGSLALGNT